MQRCGCESAIPEILMRVTGNEWDEGECWMPKTDELRTVIKVITINEISWIRQETSVS